MSSLTHEIHPFSLLAVYTGKVLHGKKTEVGFPQQDALGKEATSSLRNPPFP